MKEAILKFISIFTDCPGGRLEIHGDHSGQAFREKVLKPALLENDHVVLDLDGAVGFPSSFIDEVFGLLAQEIGYDKLKAKLEIRLTDDPLALKEIEECMLAHRA
jgi:STAS-like domain of unknown function (DUF4325)